MSSDLRPLPRGLALFTGPRNPKPSGLGGVVLDAQALRWSTLEPTPGKYQLDRIGAALDYAQAAGGLGCDLRVFAGIYAPDDLKAAGSVTYTDGQDGTSGQLPLFWRDGYVARWEALHRAIADRFGAHPLLRSVGHTLPMTVYGEPFMRGDAASRKALAGAGLTDVLDLAVHLAAVDVHARVWRPMGVRLRVACNPWVSAQTGSASVERLRLVLDYAVAQLGAAAVIVQNNSIRTPALGGQYPELYALLASYRQAGCPLGFQTASDSRIGDRAKTAEWAVQQGAHWVEPGPGFWQQDPAVLEQVSRALAANAVPWDLQAPGGAQVQQALEDSQAQLAAVRAQLADSQSQLSDAQARIATARPALEVARDALL